MTTSTAVPGNESVAATRLRALGTALRRTWIDARRVEKVAYLVGGVLFLSGLVHLGVLIVSRGSWEGPLSMRKAATFGLSFGMTLASLTWATSFVSVGARARAVLLGLFTGACVLEVVFVTMQAWRGVPSHFNFETSFDNVISMSLAAGGGVLVVTALGFTASALRAAAGTSPSMLLAVRFGFLALLVALGIGAVMIATGVGEARTGNPRLAYTTAGKLKPVHAVPMHAILVLPMLAWLLRFTNWAERQRVLLVWIAIGAYTVLTAVVGIESFTGVSPLGAPGFATATSAIALVILVAAGAIAGYALRTEQRG